MIRDEERFFATSGDVAPDGPSTWHIIDWDQRRTISVKMDQELDTEDLAIEHLKTHIDEIGHEVFLIHLAEDGKLIFSSTDPKHDQAMSVYYLPLEEVKPLEGREPIRRDELVEVERVGPGVDGVFHIPSGKQLVFRYYWDEPRARLFWDEININRRLPQHPNLVSFDNIVVEDDTKRVVGFTTHFTHGSVLGSNKNREFKLAHLQQLISVVDDLNLKYGIVHQDIKPSNIVADQETDSIKLTNFNSAARIGTEGDYREGGDAQGVLATVYELITGNVDRDTYDLDDIETSEWTQHPDLTLDRPISEYRAALKDWRERRSNSPITNYKNAPEYIDWPAMGEPAPIQRSYVMKDGSTRTQSIVTQCERRIDALANSRSVVYWERPPQSKLAETDKILSTGKKVEEKPKVSAPTTNGEEEEKEKPAMCPMGKMAMESGTYSMADIADLLKRCPFSGQLTS